MWIIPLLIAIGFGSLVAILLIAEKEAEEEEQIRREFNERTGDCMRYEIKVNRGHYVLYINGEFYGSYDTYSEAEKDADIYKNSRT